MAGGTGVADAELRRAIAALAPPGLLIGHRVILPGDELSLLDAEAASIAAADIGRRRASGAARHVARGLMARLGHPGHAVLGSPSGAPIWPAGLSGSIAHDDEVAVAAVGLRRDVGAVGIDVEPAVPLPADMLAMVATPRELSAVARDPLQAKLLFAAKEAVYKAVHPLDQVFLEFHDIEADLGRREATTRTGRVLALRYIISPRILVVASAVIAA